MRSSFSFFSESLKKITLSYQFSAVTWKIYLNNKVILKSGTDNNTGTVSYNDPGNYIFKVDVTTQRQAGSWSVTVGSQTFTGKTQSTNLVTNIPFPYSKLIFVRSKMPDALSRIPLSSFKSLLTRLSHQSVHYFNAALYDQIPNLLSIAHNKTTRFVFSGYNYRAIYYTLNSVNYALAYPEVTWQKTITSKIYTIENKSKSFNAITIEKEPVIIPPKPEPEKPEPETPEPETPEPETPVTQPTVTQPTVTQPTVTQPTQPTPRPYPTASQKYKVIDPVNYEYVRGKKVQVTRYWSIRYLTPSYVASLIARGFEVSAVDQDTPLSPRVVYAPSVVERSKELAPSVRTTSNNEPYSRVLPNQTGITARPSIIRRSHSSFRDFTPIEIPNNDLNRNRTRRRSVI